jgi:hypothetical protein
LLEIVQNLRRDVNDLFFSAENAAANRSISQVGIPAAPMFRQPWQADCFAKSPGVERRKFSGALHAVIASHCALWDTPGFKAKPTCRLRIM